MIGFALFDATDQLLGLSRNAMAVDSGSKPGTSADWLSEPDKIRVESCDGQFGRAVFFVSHLLCLALLSC